MFLRGFCQSYQLIRGMMQFFTQKVPLFLRQWMREEGNKVTTLKQLLQDVLSILTAVITAKCSCPFLPCFLYELCQAFTYKFLTLASFPYP